MRKIFLTALMIALCAITAICQNGNRLKFNANGKFKIVQFTDLHLKAGNPMSAIVYENIKNVLAAEKPDMIMLTGDNIYSAPGDVIMKELMGHLQSTGIPFALVFGNHDRQQGLSDAELLKIAQTYSNCIAGNTPGIHGDGNYDLSIRSHDGSRDAAILYCFDSGENSEIKANGIDGYDYIHHDQIDWYMKRSRLHTQQNGNFPLPSLAFFHIPIPEYQYALIEQTNPVFGIKLEAQCTPKINSGLFAAMKEMNDVMGTFCGHDHDNDYAVQYLGVMLAYGRYSGAKTEYTHLMPNGARVIELTEDQRTIDTWIRLRTGEIVDKINFPKSFDTYWNYGN
jgi:hypothetical protein